MSRLHIARAEMRLAQPDTEPLRHVAMTPHPLEPFRDVMAKVDTARGERADMIIDLLPLRPPERLAWRNRQRRAEIDSFTKMAKATRGGSFADLLNSDPAAPPEPPGLFGAMDLSWNAPAQRMGHTDTEHVEERVAVPGFQFRVQVLIRTASYDPDRARGHMEALLACWDVWGGRNWFEMVLTNLKITYLGSNVSPRRRWFDYRFRTGRFGPLRHRGARVVAMEDIRGWITPPPGTVGLAPAPAARPSPPGRTQQLPPIGNGGDETQALAGEDILDDAGEPLLLGIGRRGGTVDRLAADVVARTTRGGAGAIVLDADSAAQRAGAPGWADPSASMPLLGTDSTRAVAGWNPVLPQTADAPVDRVATAIRALTVASSPVDASQAAALIDAAVSTLRTLETFLPRELAPTLFQITRLVEDTEWREMVLPLLDGPARRFWNEVLPALDNDVVPGVTGVVRSLEDDAAAVALLGQAETTYDPYPLLAAGGTVVLSGDRAPLSIALADLLWLDASSAARALMETETPPAPVLVATATHRLATDSAGLWINDLIATARTGVKLALLTDRPDLHRDDLRRRLEDLVTMVAVGSVDAGEEAAAVWIGLDGASDLRVTLDNLGPGQCLVAAARDHWQPRPLGVGRREAHVPRQPVEPPTGVTLNSTRTRLEGLEERIAEHLLSPTPPDPDPADARDPDSGTNIISFDPSRRRKGPMGSPK